MSIVKTILSIFSAIILAMGVSSCGYDGHFRYPCQDPENWESPECQPPICIVNGACPSDLVDINIEENIIEEEPQETTSDIIEEGSDAPATKPKPENVDNINNMVNEISEGN